jgi:hypothetical protein
MAPGGGPRRETVARVLAIGHSSGGDLLAGFVAGVSVGSLGEARDGVEE